MKNYLKRLNIPRHADSSVLNLALESAVGNDDADVVFVLGNPLFRTHFERVHLQYLAMGAALDTLKHPGARDTHRWTDRLVEFKPDKESLDSRS
ncbi:MAG: hypothetical protein KAG66_25070 [Methylococcales bacterium]|nr:hypothetical protein [Methylococcales bacterium]